MKIITIYGKFLFYWVLNEFVWFNLILKKNFFFNKTFKLNFLSRLRLNSLDFEHNAVLVYKEKLKQKYNRKTKLLRLAKILDDDNSEFYANDVKKIFKKK